MKHKQWSRDPALLRGLQYFEAVARHNSVALAADEIGVSASAVSHRLRELSSALGEELVAKNGRGITLTEVGRRLSDQLADSFAGIDSIVTGVVGTPRKMLRLAVCSAFGPAWLVPRLPGFHQANPQIDLELRLYSHDPEQTQSVADALITAQPTKPGYKSVALFDEMVVAVQAPLRAQSDRPHRLITTDTDERDLGREWFTYLETSAHPLGAVKPAEFIRCTHYILALELAKAGMGVALVPDFLAAEALSNGSLVLLDPAHVPSGRSYRLCFKEALADDPSLRSLSRWLKGNVAGKVIRFQQVARNRP